MRQRKRTINLRIFFFAALAMGAGIISSSLYISIVLKAESAPAAVFFFPIFILLIPLIIFLYCSLERKRAALVSLVLAIFFSFSFTTTYYNYFCWIDGLNAPTSGKLSGVVAEGFELDLEGFEFNGILEDISLDGVPLAHAVRVQINFEPKSVMEFVDVGDRITFNTVLTPRAFIDISSSSITHAAINGVKYYAQNDSKPTRESGELPLGTRIRRKISTDCNKYLGYRYGAVAAGFLIGDVTDLDGKVRASFSALGVAHILSVSGVHIAFLSAFIHICLKKVRLKRLAKANIAAIVIVGFTALCRFVYPAMRSAITALIGGYSASLGERNDPLSNLSVAAVVILLINPLALYDIGFILSFSATLTILLFTRSFARLMQNSKKLRSLGEGFIGVLSVSMAAQIGVAVMSLQIYENVTLLSVPLNVALSPLFSLIFLMLFIAMAISLVLPFMNFLYALAYPFLMAATELCMQLSALDNITTVFYGTAAIISLLMLSAFWFSRFVMVKKPTRLAVGGVLLSLSLVLSVSLNYSPNAYKPAAYSFYTNIGVADLYIGDNNAVYLSGDFRDSSLESHLKQYKIRHIEGIILGNFTISNMYAANSIMEKFAVKKVYMPNITSAPLEILRGGYEIVLLHNNIAIEADGLSITAFVQGGKLDALSVLAREKRFVQLFSSGSEVANYLSNKYYSIDLVHSYTKNATLPKAKKYLFNVQFFGMDEGDNYLYSQNLITFPD